MDSFVDDPACVGQMRNESRVPVQSRADERRLDAHASSERRSRQRRLALCKPTRDDVGRAALIALSSLSKTSPDHVVGDAVGTSIIDILVELGFDADRAKAVYDTILKDERDAKAYWLTTRRFFARKRR